MRFFMNIKLPRTTALQINDRIDPVMETLRMSFVKEKPLTHEEWREAMSMLTAFKVALRAEMREEETND